MNGHQMMANMGINIILFDLVYFDVCRTTKEIYHAGWYYNFNVFGLFVGGQYCSTKHVDDYDVD